MGTFGWLGSLLSYMLCFLSMYAWFIAISSTQYLGSIPLENSMKESAAAGNVLTDTTDAVGSLNRNLGP
jgi:hypothetical protein